MQKLKSNLYEGKNSEETLNLALKELNASIDEVYYTVNEETSGGLFKSKKCSVLVILKNDIIEYIKNYLKEVTSLMGLTVNFEVQKREKYIKVNMISEDSAILIGKNGRTMGSLQTLLRQSVQAQTGVRINIILDANDYKEKQERNIERLAVRTAKEVLQTGIEVKMDSMNSYERRLIHNALTNFKGISTISEGEEPNRYVVIKPIEK